MTLLNCFSIEKAFVQIEVIANVTILSRNRIRCTPEDESTTGNGTKKENIGI